MGCEMLAAFTVTTSRRSYGHTNCFEPDSVVCWPDFSGDNAHPADARCSQSLPWLTRCEHRREI